MKKLVKILFKLFAICAAVYGVLFTVWYLDLDSKIIYRYVFPWLNKHYEAQEHADITQTPYNVNVDSLL